MDAADLVLLIVENSEKGFIKGRTLLQKVAYFVNETEKCEISFFPHYYGPYSNELTNATNSLVTTGILHESQTVFGTSPSTTFEMKRFDYLLTEQAKKIVGLISQEDPETTTRVAGVVKRISQSVGTDYRTLSIAAKTHHILKAKNRPMNSKEIAKVAKSMRWVIKPAQIERVYQFLYDLGLAAESQPTHRGRRRS